MEMEKSSMQENEPTSAINSFLNSLATSNPSFAQFPSSNIAKKAKNKLKPLKGLPSNVRVGDWVCLICNNLNFSFRNECNRCQIQTKEQNQMQTMQISENQIIQNNKMQNRLPFQDLTNQNYSLNKVGSTSAHIKSKSTPIESELKLNTMLRNAPQASDIDGSSSGDFVVNKGFKNMLLVTPPKHGQTKSFSIFKEYSDSGQKELPPYQSPKNLPSISPMLKRVFGYNMKEDEENSGDDEYQDLEISKQELAGRQNYTTQENKQAAISNPFRQPRKLENLPVANQSSSENDQHPKEEVFNFQTQSSANFESRNFFE